jgi:hypothetical protein
VDGLWKASGLAADATPGETEARRQRAVEIRRFDFMGCAGRLDLRRLRVPQVDVERFDFLDQQQDCLAGGTQLFALRARQSRSPAPKLVDLVLVKTLAQGSSRRLTP